MVLGDLVVIVVMVAPIVATVAFSIFHPIHFADRPAPAVR
jgi:hypothetical protein